MGSSALIAIFSHGKPGRCRQIPDGDEGGDITYCRMGARAENGRRRMMAEDPHAAPKRPQESGPSPSGVIGMRDGSVQVAS